MFLVVQTSTVERQGSCWAENLGTKASEEFNSAGWVPWFAGLRNVDLVGAVQRVMRLGQLAQSCPRCFDSVAKDLNTDAHSIRMITPKRCTLIK